MSNMLLVLTNVPDQQTAANLADKLVSLRLAACVNLISGMQSVYRWEGVIEHAAEVSLLIKTWRDRYEEVRELIHLEHSYDVPEIIALPVEAGLTAYLEWVRAETRKEEV